METNKEIRFKMTNGSIFQTDMKFYFTSIKDWHGLSNATSRLFNDFLNRSDTVLAASMGLTCAYLQPLAFL
jgi:alkyl sulfatase BDS1-like metallo-beta-lactamase superfamily hydrolase